MKTQKQTPITSVAELTIMALKRAFYIKDGRERRLTTVCYACAWMRRINCVMICGRRKHWEVLKPGFSNGMECLDANCPYFANQLTPYPSLLQNKSILYLDAIIKELKARGGRPSDG